MKRFVRESKFRHIFGQTAPKEKQFEGVIVSKSRLEGNFCAANSKFIAIVLNTTGAGVFTVLARDQPGRIENVPRCVGHSSEILDLSFDPFNPNRIISGGEDGSFIVWYVPDGGLQTDCSECLASIRPSQRRAVHSTWHSSASDVVFLANLDCISVVELEEYSTLRVIKTSSFSDQLFNISLNADSSVLVAAFRDKKVRTFDTHTGEKLAEFAVFDGNKPTRVQYLHGLGDLVFCTGTNRMAERRIGIWDLKNPSEPVFQEEVDNEVAVLNMFYDPDTSLISVYGKGESTVRIYELEAPGQAFLVSTFQNGDQQKASCFANKLACNPNICEIMHYVKATAKGVETVAFTVPRKSELFQEDLFPDTNSDQPAMSAKDFASGRKSMPLKVSMRDYSVSVGMPAPATHHVTTAVNRNATVMSSGASQPRVNLNDLNSRVTALEAKVEDILKRL